MNTHMNSVSCHSDYLLGSSDAEQERLIRQAMRLAPSTERFFRDAGIGPGQRVLELGSGVGDVAMLAARLVGSSGEVVGIECDARSINRARARAAAAGLRNVSFLKADISHFLPNSRFDAAVGRYILQFLPAPVATLRSLVKSVKPGGIVAFQEVSFAPFIALSVNLPLWSALVSLHHQVAIRCGVNTEMGPALHRAFRDAGLPAPTMHLEIELGDDSDFARNISDATMSILPQLKRFDLSVEELGDLGTLQQRLQEEVAAANVAVPWLPLVGARCRTPSW